MHPYAQGGWPSPASSIPVNNGARITAYPPQTSIFGALPSYPAAAPSQTLLTFNFVSFRPNILNCVVSGPQNKQYFRVVSNNSTPGTTLFQRADGKNFAVVEWQQNSIVEARDVIQRQHVSQWLALSPDRRSVIVCRFLGISSDDSIVYFTARGQWKLEESGTLGHLKAI